MSYNGVTNLNVYSDRNLRNLQVERKKNRRNMEIYQTC